MELTWETSKISTHSYRQQIQYYLSFDDQLQLNFIAEKLFSLDDVTQTLRKLIKITNLFRTILKQVSTQRPTFFVQTQLISPIKVLQKISANIRNTFDRFNHEEVIINIEVRKIVQEIHTLISRKGEQLNQITTSPFVGMISKVKKWSDSINLLQRPVKRLLSDFQKMKKEQQEEKKSLKRKREILKDRFKNRTSQHSQRSRLPGHISKIQQEHIHEGNFQDYGIQSRQEVSKNKAFVNRKVENSQRKPQENKKQQKERQKSGYFSLRHQEEKFNTRNLPMSLSPPPFKLNEYGLRSQVPKKQEKERGCISLTKIFRRIFSKDKKE